MKFFDYIFISISLAGSISFSQISLDGIGTYSEDFNTLANSGTSSTVPSGWAFSEAGTSGNNDGLYTAGIGSSATGDTYSFGSTGSNERAFGELTSGTLSSMIGCQFINQTGNTITQLPFTYIGEQWRLGATGRQDKLDFQYSLDATSLTTGTWTDVNELDFVAPVTSGTVGLLDGNSSANRTVISYSITGLSILNNASFWIKWRFFDATSNDDGLAIDDFSINESALPVEISSFTVKVLKSGGVQLNWRTETEVNNYGFEVHRAEGNFEFRNSNFELVGFVEGHGNSNSPKEYSFVDQPVSSGKYSYRLKQIDTDGQFEYSKLIEVDAGNIPDGFVLEQNYPNPFNPTTKIDYQLPFESNVMIELFNITGERVGVLLNQELTPGYYTAEVNSVQFRLSSGVYIYRMTAVNTEDLKSYTQLKKMVVLK